MERSDKHRLKKAVVSLQKLNLPCEESNLCAETSRDNIDSGGSEDTVSENTVLDSVDSNVGCTDDDDLEKKIQAFSIPVKKDEKSVGFNEYPIEEMKEGNVSDDNKSTGSQPTIMLKADTTTKETFFGKEKIALGNANVEKGKSENKVSTLEKEKQTTRKTVSEEGKVSHSKITKEKEKMPHGKVTGGKGKPSSIKTTTSKERTENKEKNEAWKSSQEKHRGDKLSTWKPRKRQHSMDSKSNEKSNISNAKKLSKSQKYVGQVDSSSPSSSKANNGIQIMKSNIVKKKRSDTHDSEKIEFSVKNLQKLMSNSRKTSLKDKNENASSDSPEPQESKRRKLKETRKVSDNLKVASAKENPESERKTKESERKSSIILNQNVLKQKATTLLDQEKHFLHKKKQLQRKESREHPISEDVSLSKKDFHDSHSTKFPKIKLQDKEKKEFAQLLNLEKNNKTHSTKGKLRNGSKSSKNNVKAAIQQKSFASKSRSSLEKSGHLRGTSERDSPKFDKMTVKKMTSSCNEKLYDKNKRSEKLHSHRASRSKVINKQNNSVKKKEDNSREPSKGSKNSRKNNYKRNFQNEIRSMRKSFLTEQVFKSMEKKCYRFPTQTTGTESYKKLWKWTDYIRMPSSSWSLHKHPEGKFVAILHISEMCSLPKIVIDKSVHFTETAHAVVKLYGTEIPSLRSNDELQTLGQVCAFLKNIDNLSLCESLKTTSLDVASSKCQLYTNDSIKLPYICNSCTCTRYES